MKTVRFKSLKNKINLVVLAVALTTGMASCQNAQSKKGVEQPSMDIHTAVLYNNLEAIRQHIEAGSDLNQKDAFGGSTPLITAATFGQDQIVRALIQAGADLTVQNNDGSTALHAAAFFGRVEIVQMLLDAHADKTVRNNYGHTARESVMGPFAEVKPVYEMMQNQLGPLGLQLDMAELEKTRPVIALMLQ